MGANLHVLPVRPGGEPLEGPYVRPRQAAEHFGVSIRSLRRYRAAGMPARRVRGTVLYPLRACERWMAEQGSDS
jgi:phage terminase Nu1 subunit (DNA packaging protein)